VPENPGVIHGEVAEFPLSSNPDRVIMVVAKLSGPRARRIANDAVREARQLMPKMSGRAASRLFPLYGYGYFGIGWQDCVAFGMRVLRSDWQWVPVEKISAGDSLIAVDEEVVPGPGGYRGRGRRYRTAQVVAAVPASRPCVEIEFDDGFKFTCTRTHPLLGTRYDGHPRKWMKAGELRPGDMIGYYLPTWNEDRSRSGGWLAGIYDGEGSLAYNNSRGHEEWTNSGSLLVTQNPGHVLEEIKELLSSRGFRYRTASKEKTAVQLEITGGFAEQARFLGSIRPLRLLPKLRHENRYMRALRERRVTAVRDAGEQIVMLLETTQRTYMSEGMASHNSYTWYQDNGIRPFTLYALAGKTIPMWVDDPTGTERLRNPKAQTRVTLSGKVQILIFRRAAQIGQRKTVRTKVAGQWETRTVPLSYPGAPGRIGRREAGRPYTSIGRTGGQIASGNVGVRWRHPGAAPRKFLNRAMVVASQRGLILPVRLYIADRNWRAHF
jgi:hypothetical protein